MILSASQVTECSIPLKTFCLKVEKLFGSDHEFSKDAEALLTKVNMYRDTLGESTTTTLKRRK